MSHTRKLPNGARVLSLQVSYVIADCADQFGCYNSTFRHWRHCSMAQFHITDKQSSLQRADEAKAIGRDDESIVAYILGGDQNSVSGFSFSFGQSHRKECQAVKLGVKRLARQISEPFQLSPTTKKILQHLRNIWSYFSLPSPRHLLSIPQRGST